MTWIERGIYWTLLLSLLAGHSSLLSRLATLEKSQDDLMGVVVELGIRELHHGSAVAPPPETILFDRATAL